MNNKENSQIRHTQSLTLLKQCHHNKNININLVNQLYPVCKKSSIRQSYLPPVTNKYLPNSLINSDTVNDHRGIFNKGLITQEWENLERSKQRGTLTPKYSVLPPIGGENKIQAEPFQNNNINDNNNNNNNNNNEQINPNITFTDLSTREEDNINDEDNNTISKSQPLFEIYPAINTNNNSNEKTLSEPFHALPKSPLSSNGCRRGNKNNPEVEQYDQALIEWFRKKGRRNAVCFEMDPLFQELSSIIKHNLLVQHLEEIWMC